MPRACHRTLAANASVFETPTLQVRCALVMKNRELLCEVGDLKSEVKILFEFSQALIFRHLSGLNNTLSWHNAKEKDLRASVGEQGTQFHMVP